MTLREFFEEFFCADDIEVVSATEIRVTFRGFREGFKSSEIATIDSSMEMEEIVAALRKARNEAKDMSWVDRLED